MTRVRTSFSSISDYEAEVMLRAQYQLQEAFATVRPSDALITLARKTLAWMERGAPR